MSRSSEVKVGAVVILAILALLGVGFYLLGPGRIGRAYHIDVIFSDAQGMTGGEPVRMAGVQIGEVKEVALAADRKARVSVLIKQDVPLYRGYLFTISTGALVPEKFVDVEPVIPPKDSRRLAPGAVVQGLESPGLQQLFVAAQGVLTQLQQTATSINAIIGDPAIAKATRESMQNFALATHDAAATMNQLSQLTAATRPELIRAAREIARASEEASSTASLLSRQLRATNAPRELEASIRAIGEAAVEARDTAASLRKLIDQPGMQGDVTASLANIRQMTENLNAASANIRDATGEIKTSAPEAGQLIRKANTLLSEAGSLKDILRPPKVTPNFAFRVSPQAGRSFTDANFDISFGGQEDRFLRLGIADLGEQNQVNLQAGRRSDGRNLRYGLVRSKLGGGVDVPLSSKDILSLDVFDPNRLRSDITLEHHFRTPDPGWSLILGVRDLFDHNYGFIGGQIGK